MPDIKVFGKKVPPLTLALVGIGGAVAVFFVIKQKKASSASASSAIDPVTGLPTSQDNALDPLTGQGYLSEAQSYGSVAAAESALSAGQQSGSGGVTSAVNSGGGGGGAPPNNNVVPGTSYGSNSAWAQAVEAGLTDIGYTSTDVSAALGRYLGNLSETSAQAAIVQAALAEYGPPPVGSFQIKQSSGTPTTPTTSPIPNVVGLTASHADSVLNSAGFKGASPGIAANTLISSQSPAGGTHAAQGTVVTLKATAASLVAVPNVVGQEAGHADQILDADGFKGATPGIAATAKITSQHPAAGTKAARGSTVTLKAAPAKKK